MVLIKTRTTKGGWGSSFQAGMYITWEAAWSLCPELIDLGTQHILTQHCLWRACILLPKITEPNFGAFDCRGNEHLGSLLDEWYQCDHSRDKPLFRLKEGNFIWFFWPSPKCWTCLRNRRLCRCGTGGSVPDPRSMVGDRSALVLRPQVLIFCFPKCIICHLSLWFCFFKLVWGCPDRKVNPCLS